VQAPRPPITIGANSDGALRIAARYADAWNTWGGFELSVEEFFEATVNRSHRLDQLCADIGRDPSTLRRSLLRELPRICEHDRDLGVAHLEAGKAISDERGRNVLEGEQRRVTPLDHDRCSRGLAQALHLEGQGSVGERGCVKFSKVFRSTAAAIASPWATA
jgi:alkanesulfonate monooxygenase SsuD/methylene tetrahydromethanopterin reductase-like flavin-dependent oxidoreductase (luciferase family)